MSDDRIDLDDDGTPDDVALWNVEMVHIERMDTGHIWMRCDKADGTAIVCNFATPRNGRLNWLLEKDW